MNMWIIFMVILFAFSLAGILYLADRISHFYILKKWTKNKKREGVLVGAVIVIIVTVLLWKIWGSMNAIVCILHLLVFWIISDCIFIFVEKVHKKYFTDIMRA